MPFEDWATIVELFPDFAVKLGVAVFCGLLLGAERERMEKPAGLRTIVLITVGSTLFMIVSDLMPRISIGADETMRVDPARIAAQVVTGIGFLGAGTIIQTRGSVHGLTTAAIIWFAAAVGLCIGIGFPILAIASTVLMLLTLISFRPLRKRLSAQSRGTALRLFVPNDSLRVQHIRHLLDATGAQVDQFETQPFSTDEVELRLNYYVSETTAAAVLETLMKIDGVRGEPVSGAA